MKELYASKMRTPNGRSSMLKQITIGLLLTGYLAAETFVVAAQTGPPQRKVEGNTITSTSDPAAKIQLLNSPVYVGADRWILYGFSNCELHAFVQAGTQKKVQRLYWVQFESYLPTRPELHHMYDSPRHTQISGLDFYVDTWVEPTGEHIKPDSDVEHIHSLLETHGYKLPSGMMSVRLVHLLDEQKRKELMFIYSEDVASTGHTASELSSGGPAHDQWPKIERGFIERAEKSIAIHPPSNP
jgi:hypothetical protein